MMLMRRATPLLRYGAAAAIQHALPLLKRAKRLSSDELCHYADADAAMLPLRHYADAMLIFRAARCR